MEGDLRVSRSVTIPERDLRWRFSRSSGPGGQGVNTTDSRVQLSVDVGATGALGPVQRARALERLEGRLVDGVLTITVQDERSQLRNRELALERLRDAIAAAIAPPHRARRPTKPAKAAVERRIRSKKRRSRTKRLRGISDEDRS